MPASLPLVSVIIPCYRQAQFLPFALESVLAQTYPAVETVVVNDGSDDDTAQVADRYAKQIAYIYQPNGGLSRARNAGIGACRGDYLLFLDADDLLHPNAVEWQIQAMQGNLNRLCVMDYESFEEEPPRPRSTCVYLAELIAFFPSLVDYSWGPPSCFLSPKSMVELVGGFDATFGECEDLDLWLRLAFQRPECVRVHLPGVFYRRHAGSMSSNFPRMLRGRTKGLLTAHRQLMTDPCLVSEWGQTMLRAQYRLRRRWIATGLDASMVYELTKAIKELEDRGVTLDRKGVRKLLPTFMGSLASEQLVMSYFHWLKPRTFKDYATFYN
jgi:glycosyltransferase involved in cell wall biosynthesis